MGLDLVELVMTVEERFEIDIPDEEAAELTTANRITDYFFAKIGGTSHAARGSSTQDPWTRESIRSEVRRIILEQLSVPEDFSDNVRFSEDLGVD
ncbi:MAG TPA: phosphopantetheine-binding protein [Terriglobales bacterium]|nr:phosphopantetheine-binding protein [Terriglobales bacterium]